MNNLIYYALNIVLFALPMALIEISIEKSQGWGGGISRESWFGKTSLKGTFADKVITKITGFESPLNFHIVIMIVFHAIFVLEYIFGTHNLILLAACYFAVNVFADFFWFSLNWYFHSFKELLKGPNGAIHWHKKWLKIGKDKYIPRTYPMWLGLSLILLVLAQYWR